MGMTIDERLEFLTQSTESLHATSQELHAALAQQAAESQRLHRAVLAAMQAYLTEMSKGDETNGNP